MHRDHHVYHKNNKDASWLVNLLKILTNRSCLYFFHIHLIYIWRINLKMRNNYYITRKTLWQVEVTRMPGWGLPGRDVVIITFIELSQRYHDGWLDNLPNKLRWTNRLQFTTGIRVVRSAGSQVAHLTALSNMSGLVCFVEHLVQLTGTVVHTDDSRFFRATGLF